MTGTGKGTSGKGKPSRRTTTPGATGAQSPATPRPAMPSPAKSRPATPSPAKSRSGAPSPAKSRSGAPRAGAARTPSPRTTSARTGGARGTAARPGAGPGRSRATASGAVRKAASTQVAIERRASRAVLRSVVLASIFVLLAVTLVPTLRSYLRQQGQIESLRGQVTAQRNTVADLQKEQARWNDDAYVTQQARERLKFVKVGEKSYTVIDGTPSATALPGVAQAPAASSDHPWYGQLWESVRVADAGPAGTGTTSTSK